MYLYNISLQKSTAITNAIYGNFSAPRAQEIVVARGKILEILRPDDDTGKVLTLCSTEVFGVIRSIIPFRLMGANTDYIIVGSDSGRISILSYDAAKNEFVKVHEETYGKSGCRRIVPGQYLAVDPRGRACMIGSIEKSKLVYVLNRDSEANLTISSPLEAHKSHTIVMSMCGVDVQFENPVFACLEMDYEADLSENNGKPAKMVTYYELDLGLNHVTRRWTEQTDDGANMVLTVPGGNDGPGGVLVCAENWIIYKDQDHKEIMAQIPRRYGLPDEQGVLIVSAATHVQKNLFFFLVQSEAGDIYKVTLIHDEDTVQDVQVKYFDTIAPSTDICVLKTGFLFSASEFANHYLFQFRGIGDDDDTPATSARLTGDQFVYFQPRELTNLALIDEVEALNPIMDMKIADLTNEHTPQIYTMCGRGPRSTVRVLRHGLEVTEMAVSELPGVPNAVWAVKTQADHEHCSYIVVSFVNATIVLSIGETVEEVTDSGIEDSTQTLSMSLMGGDSLLQIHPDGIRHIQPGGVISHWNPSKESKKTVQTCAVNGKQVVLALSGGTLMLFELNEQVGKLRKLAEKDMGVDIKSLALGPVPPGRQRAMHMAVGSYDNTVRVLSLDPENRLEQLSVQMLSSPPSSLRIVGQSTGTADDSNFKHFLYIGLENGILIRSTLREMDGSVADTRKRFLGTQPVRLFETEVQGKPGVMALSSRSWLSYMHQGRHETTPLSYDRLEYCSSFSSEQCPEGMVAVAGNTLRIISLESLGQMFNQTVVPLRYTPRKFDTVPVNNYIIMLESDQNSYPFVEKEELQKAIKSMDDDDDGMDTGEKKSKRDDPDDDEDDEDGNQEIMMGTPMAGLGKWASCLRIVNPESLEDTFILELEDNEAAFSMCHANFGDSDGETYLVVGTVKDLVYVPRSLSAAFIHVYKYIESGTKLELLHKTEVKEPCLALSAYGDRLLAGVGNTLRIYELGQRKLLRKCENGNFPTTIVSIDVQGDRIYVGDQMEAFHYCNYDRKTKQLIIFADNDCPRYITARAVVDYDTIAAGDKFGNVFVTRLPSEISSAITKDPTGGQLRGKYGEIIHGSAHKMVDIVNYHIGESLTSLRKTSLTPGGSEVLIYSTILGGIGCFIPFTSKEDTDFFSHLEMHLRQEISPLCGRDHLAFRSYYFPVKDCIDGDLCEMFLSLPFDRQAAIAEELVSTPSDVQKKLEEMRTRVL